jgi:chaperone BCS1
LFDKIESLMKETKITPADVAESLMPKSPLDDAEKCLSHLIQALEEAEEATEKADKDASRQNAQAATKAAEGRAKEDAAQPQENSH